MTPIPTERLEYLIALSGPFVYADPRPLARELLAAREALAFYANGWKFKTNKRYGGLEYSPTEELLDDCGNRARALLPQPEKVKP